MGWPATCSPRHSIIPFTEDDAAAARPDAEADFHTRLGFVDWSLAGKGETAFSQSQTDLVRWAPVTEEFKQQDSEIVMNSIRFRWREVREQLRKRAVPAAIQQEWRSRSRAERRQTPGPE